MTISELIKKLETFKELYGDINVRVINDTCSKDKCDTKPIASFHTIKDSDGVKFILMK